MDGKVSYVTLGKIVGVHGLQGWLKVYSYCDPRKKIFEYAHWWLGKTDIRRKFKLESGRIQGKGLIARVALVDQRVASEELVGLEIAVPKDQLVQLEENEFYWSDLEGCRVTGLDGFEFGVVERILPTGANDVMQVKGERQRLIPFLQGRFVMSVDIENQRIEVDWDPEF